MVAPLPWERVVGFTAETRRACRRAGLNNIRVRKNGTRDDLRFDAVRNYSSGLVGRLISLLCSGSLRGTVGSIVHCESTSRCQG